jgi:hypothetical protein
VGALKKNAPSGGRHEHFWGLNNVVANFEKHTFLSQTDLRRTGIISNCYNEMFEA